MRPGPSSPKEVSFNKLKGDQTAVQIPNSLVISGLKYMTEKAKAPYLYPSVDMPNIPLPVVKHLSQLP